MRLRATRLTAIAGAVRRAFPVFSPADLFANNAPGVWYDLSLTDGTLFQDAAGTVPVTAVEQPVGLVKDKSGRGNHAFQVTSASRPVLSARYNLQTKTEQCDDAAWTKTNVTVTANAAVAPDGTLTADLISPTTTSSSGTLIAQSQTLSGAPNTYTARYRIKPSGFSWVVVAIRNLAGNRYIWQWFDLANTAVGSRQTSSFVFVSATITAVAEGFFECSLTCTINVTETGTGSFVALADANSSLTATASGNNGILLWGADLRVANDGVGLPPYQRVNTATDYDTVGFPLYLRFNGSTQFLQTNSIYFSSTDKVLVAAGVRKLSDSTAATVAELSANSGVTPNTFAMFAPGAVAPDYAFRSSGTSDSVATATTFASPITNVLVGLGEVASDTAILRINGTQAASSAADQGTGNLGQHPLYIGARAGTSLFFNGRLYSLIIAGIKPTDAQILGVETYINRLTRAF